MSLFINNYSQVANHMLNPNGHDDEDFDLNFLIDRHATLIHTFTQVTRDQQPPLDPLTLSAPILFEIKPPTLKQRLTRVLTR